MPRKRVKRRVIPLPKGARSQKLSSMVSRKKERWPPQKEEPAEIPEPWTWGDFLLGESESTCITNVPEEFQGELEDCDGGTAHAFYVVIGREAVPYDPQEITDLDKFAASLLHQDSVRRLHLLKMELKEQSVNSSMFTVLPSKEDVIYVAAHYTTTDMVHVQYCVTVFLDRSFKVQVHNYILSQDHPFFDGVPALVDGVSAINRILDKLASCKICIGNCDPRMQKLVPIGSFFSELASEKENIVAFREPNMGASYKSTIRSTKCPVLLVQETLRCRPCRIFRKTLLKRVSRCPLQSVKNLSSSRASHSNMSKQDLCAKLKASRRARENLQSEIEKLRKDVRREIDVNGHKMNDADNRDLISLLKEHNNAVQSQFQDGSLPRIFWEQQLEYHSRQKKTGMRWHPMIIRWCLYLKHKSSAAYDTLCQSGFITLPSCRTLYDYSNIIGSRAGFLPETVTHLKIEAGKAGMYCHSWNNYVGILQDEMHVCEGLVYNKHTGELVGYTDLNSTAEELSSLQRKKSGQGGRELATNVLVLMVRGATSSLKYPFASFATRGITSEFLYPIIWQAVRVIETSCNLKVLYITCDGASANRRFFKLNKVSRDKHTYWCWNIYAYPERRKLYFVSDVPHLLKTTRNCFSNSFSHSRSRLLWKDNYDISWQHVVKLYEDLVSQRVFSQTHKLTANHVHLTAYSKMKVNYAAQILSKSVASSLEQNYGDPVKETVCFIHHMNRFFDCLNTRNLQEAHRKGNPDLAEYRSADDPRLDYLLNEFLGYFQSWEQSVAARPCFTKKEKAKMMLSHQTLAGLHISVHSIVEMIKFLLGQGAPFVLTHHFNQDPLEEHFAHCRQKGGSNNNPTVNGMFRSSSKLRVIGSSALAPVRGNITNRKRGNANYAIDNTPLCKRKK